MLSLAEGSRAIVASASTAYAVTKGPLALRYILCRFMQGHMTQQDADFMLSVEHQLEYPVFAHGEALRSIGKTEDDVQHCEP